MNIPVASHNVKFPGYGAFWVANSISSTLLGFKNRKLQREAHEQNIEFQMEMERARFITENEKLQEDIAFKRRLMALSREYRQKETRTSFCEQMKAVELKQYLQYCWPLDPQLPYILLEELANPRLLSANLNVILMHSPLLSYKGYITDTIKQDEKIYNELEYSIKKNDIPLIGNVNYRKDACTKLDLSGGNASIMNIHFLMSQMPTLVILPQYREGKIFIIGAVWEPQAARPLIQPLLSFDFLPIETKNNEKYRAKVIDLFHTCISIIIGCVRDSYMLLTQGKRPSLKALLNDKEHEYMRQIVMEEDGIRDFIKQENDNILAALNEKNMPQLLDVFNQEDIMSIKEQVQKNVI